jgi:hypothetical protein
MQCDVRGDLLAVPQRSGIIAWSAQDDEPQGELRRPPFSTSIDPTHSPAFRNGPGGELTALAFSSTGGECAEGSAPTTS